MADRVDRVYSLAVPCDACYSDAGEPCFNDAGEEYVPVHDARLEKLDQRMRNALDLYYAQGTVKP